MTDDKERLDHVEKLSIESRNDLEKVVTRLVELEKKAGQIDRIALSLQERGIFECIVEIQKLKDLMVEKTPRGKDKLTSYARSRIRY